MHDTKRFHSAQLPTQEVLGRVMDAAPADVRLMIELITSAALRSSELTDMLYGEIDWTAGKLLVGRKDDVPNGMILYIGNYHQREVVLSGDLLSKLEAHRKNSVFSGVNHPVFPNKRGQHLKRFAMDRRLSAVFDRLHFPDDPNTAPTEKKRFRWHDLRRLALTDQPQ